MWLTLHYIGLIALAIGGVYITAITAKCAYLFLCDMLCFLWVRFREWNACRKQMNRIIEKIKRGEI